MNWQDILKGLVQYTGTCKTCGKYVSKLDGDSCPMQNTNPTSPCPMQFTNTDDSKRRISDVWKIMKSKEVIKWKRKL